MRRDILVNMFLCAIEAILVNSPKSYIGINITRANRVYDDHYSSCRSCRSSLFLLVVQREGERERDTESHICCNRNGLVKI